MNDRIAKQNDRCRLHDIRPTAAAHRLKCAPEARNLIFGNLNDEIGFLCIVACDGIHEKRRNKDNHDAGKIHKSADPTRIIKESTRKQGDNGNLRATRHKRCKHGSSTAFTLIANGAARHNTGNGTTNGNNKRNDGFTGKTYLFEDRIKNDRHTRHIAAILKQSKEEIHDHDKQSKEEIHDHDKR